MGSIPWFLFLLLHYWYIEIQPISVHWFYILQLAKFMDQSSSCLVESFGFSIWSIMLSVKSESLTSSLPIRMTFITLQFFFLSNIFFYALLCLSFWGLISILLFFFNYLDCHINDRWNCKNGWNCLATEWEQSLALEISKI